MTDLQLGLLVIGAAAVAAVLLYNRRQERAARREAERAFGGARGDVLLDAGARRQEPRFAVQADYVIGLRLARSMPAGIAEHWRSLQQRFGRRAMLSGADSSEPEAALQIVSRDGVASEAEVLEFRALVESLARSLGASVSAPEVRGALQAARELDRVCAEADIQVALHVLGPTAKRLDAPNQPFEISEREGGLTLTLDVARSADAPGSFQAMVKAARQLAGRMVDDNGRALDDGALASIAAEIEAVHRRLAERGIQPGGPLAMRLFS
jgi:ZipA, C-terminal FtsZ-binding domain